MSMVLTPRLCETVTRGTEEENDVRSAGGGGARRVRPQLTRGTILDAALRLAATGGAEPLTVRRLGKELGADPTAIYRHFRDKDEPSAGRRPAHRGLRGSRRPRAAPWRARLSTLAEVSLEILCAHPTIGAEAAIQTTGGPGELAAVDLIIRAINEAGLVGPTTPSASTRSSPATSCRSPARGRGRRPPWPTASIAGGGRHAGSGGQRR